MVKRRKRKIKETESLKQAREDHREFLAGMGISTLHKIKKRPLEVEDRVKKDLPPLSNGIGSGLVPPERR